MTRFHYTARDDAGRSRSGTREAVSERDVVEGLRANGLVPTSVAHDAAVSRRGATSSASQAARGGRGVLSPRSLDVEVALQQLALMLRSGLPLVTALRVCSEQAERPSMARALRSVSVGIQGGCSLREAFGAEPCFPRVVVAMVSVGERTGLLEQVLERASVSLERRRLLTANVATALTYPAIVVLMAICVVGYMTVSLIPKLQTFLTSFGRTLPPLTQALLDVSAFVRTHVVHGVVGTALLIAAWIALRRWPPAALAIDRAVLRIPVVSRVLRLAATAHFSRTLATLLSSGVRLTDALSEAAQLHANREIVRAVTAARERVIEGSALAPPLAETRAFMPMLASMVSVGESAGTLDDVLDEVARFHESQLDTLIRRLSSLIEPLVILVVGGIVAFVYVACFMAIYAIAGNR